MRIYSVYLLVATGAPALLSLQDACGLKLKLRAAPSPLEKEQMQLRQKAVVLVEMAKTLEEGAKAEAIEKVKEVDESVHKKMKQMVEEYEKEKGKDEIKEEEVVLSESVINSRSVLHDATVGPISKYEGKEGPLQLYIRLAGNSITNPEEDNAPVCCEVVPDAKFGDVREQLKRRYNDTSFRDLFLRVVFVFGGKKVNDDEALEALGIGTESHVELIQQRVPRPSEVGDSRYIATLDEKGKIIY